MKLKNNLGKLFMKLQNNLAKNIIILGNIWPVNL